MNKVKGNDDRSAAAKAKIVRAFYDAAERAMEELDRGQATPNTVSLSARKLEALLARTDDRDSVEFAAALERAAEFLMQSSAAANPPDTDPDDTKG